LVALPVVTEALLAVPVAVPVDALTLMLGEGACAAPVPEADEEPGLTWLVVVFAAPVPVAIAEEEDTDGFGLFAAPVPAEFSALAFVPLPASGLIAMSVASFSVEALRDPPLIVSDPAEPAIL
jgi:hypothetical protein